MAWWWPQFSLGLDKSLVPKGTEPLPKTMMFHLAEVYMHYYSSMSLSWTQIYEVMITHVSWKRRAIRVYISLDSN